MTHKSEYRRNEYKNIKLLKILQEKNRKLISIHLNL